MRFVIVTGMSGAGRGTSLKILEDAGYFCVANLPISLIGKFADLIYSSTSEISKVALGLDIRSGKTLDELVAGSKYEESIVQHERELGATDEEIWEFLNEL